MLSAIGNGQLAFGVRACCTNHAKTQSLAPLASNQAHTTRCSMEQHMIAGLQAFNGTCFQKQVLCS
jgi:hypothetical protein